MLTITASLKLPVGWTRFQNPISHMKSYNFAEKGRFSIVLPYVLRMFLREEFCRSDAWRRIKKEFAQESTAPGFSVEGQVIRLAVALATSNALIFKESLTEEERGMTGQRIMGFRLLFQRFGKLMGTDKDLKKGENIIKRPNIHQGLHFPIEMVLYALLAKTLTDDGEANHKQLKAIADASNGVGNPNPCAI